MSANRYSITAVILIAALSAPARGYAVFTHESIVDHSWSEGILPLLARRFPQASESEIEAARNYAYGGALIQDLGYFPASNPFFSELTHYVRSGDFVQALVSRLAYAG